LVGQEAYTTEGPEPQRQSQWRRHGRIARLTFLTLSALITATAADYQWDVPKGFPPPRVPADNPMSEARVALGRYLFYDTRLSVNSAQSCASCHRQELAFTDARATARGATGQDHPRSAMSLVNVAYSSVLTWNNPLLHSLERQTLVPMFSEHPIELGLRGRESAVLTILRADPAYRTQFPKAFPGEAAPFTFANVAKAIACFERTIISARSPYDRYYTGNDPNAISEAAKRGEVLFYTDPNAGCFRCHSGSLFSDDISHNTALHPDDPRKFKTPTLRNIAITAPYMHDGSIATLEEVLDHYAAGGRAHGNPNRDPRMKPLVLTSQNRADLLAFLRSLTDEELLRDPRFANPW
jgi:cytochrome c peroxidase